MTTLFEIVASILAAIGILVGWGIVVVVFALGVGWLMTWKVGK